MRIALVTISLFFSIFVFSQIQKVDTLGEPKKIEEKKVSTETRSEKDIIGDLENANAPLTSRNLNPTKAGLYSAILPGLGQYYNKKYWKIPIVWGAIGAGIGGTIYASNQYKRFRNAFVAELNGQTHEFSNVGFTDLKGALGRKQDEWKRYRDYWIAGTALVYILNIVDSVVDAHLSEGRKDPDLAVRPTLIQNEFMNQNLVTGLSFNYNF